MTFTLDFNGRFHLFPIAIPYFCFGDSEKMGHLLILYFFIKFAFPCTHFQNRVRSLRKGLWMFGEMISYMLHLVLLKGTHSPNHISASLMLFLNTVLYFYQFHFNHSWLRQSVFSIYKMFTAGHYSMCYQWIYSHILHFIFWSISYQIDECNGKNCTYIIEENENAMLWVQLTSVWCQDGNMWTPNHAII